MYLPLSPLGGHNLFNVFVSNIKLEQLIAVSCNVLCIKGIPKGIATKKGHVRFSNVTKEP